MTMTALAAPVPRGAAALAVAADGGPRCGSRRQWRSWMRILRAFPPVTVPFRLPRISSMRHLLRLSGGRDADCCGRHPSSMRALCSSRGWFQRWRTGPCQRLGWLRMTPKTTGASRYAACDWPFRWHTRWTRPVGLWTGRWTGPKTSSAPPARRRPLAASGARLSFAGGRRLRRLATPWGARVVSVAVARHFFTGLLVVVRGCRPSHRLASA